MAVRIDASGEHYSQATTFDGATCTITCWARIDVDRNTFSSAWNIDDGTNALQLQTNSDGVTWMIFDTGSGITDLFAATVGVWYFIAVVKDSNPSGTKAYWATATEDALNTGTSTHSVSASMNNLMIGESVAGGEWLNGSIAAVKIWQGVTLTQAEIENERFQYLPHRTANLYAFYPFLEGGTGAGAKQDFSGNGNTLSGGTNSATTDGPPIPWRRSFRQIFGGAEAAPPPPEGGYYLNEDDVDRFLLEDGSGVLILEETFPPLVPLIGRRPNGLVRM